MRIVAKIDYPDYLDNPEYKYFLDFLAPSALFIEGV